MIETLAIASVAIGITLIYASYRDIRERRVPFRTWYPMLVIAAPLAAWTYISLIATDVRIASAYILVVAAFCALFYFFAAYLHLFGGADAWALIFITACIPLFPFEPAYGYPPFAFFPMSVLVNAMILNLATPLCIFGYNLLKGNRAPFPYPFLGFPVDGARIEEAFGFVMEEFSDDNGVLQRRFLSLRHAIRRMIAGERRMYTRDLKRFPDEYRTELSLYRRAGTVWISYGVPFMIPITAGFLTALIMGDLLYTIMTIITGGIS
ncbi:MAG: peptidase A24 [Methanomicrobiales archaeon]|nr:peptidase A24 [Methanomicrobiales archaeon]